MWEHPQKVSPAGRATKTMYRIVRNICRNTPEHSRLATEQPQMNSDYYDKLVTDPIYIVHLQMT